MPDISLKEKASHGSVLIPMQFYPPWNEQSLVTVPAHWHNEIEIIYIERGSLTAEKNLEKQTFAAGEFCIFGKGDLHRLYADELGVRHYAVVFSLDMLSFEHFDEAQSSVIAPLLSGEMQFPYRITSCPALVSEFMSLVTAISEQRRNWYFSAKVSLLKMLSVMLSENLMLTENVPESAAPYRLEMIKKAIAYIQQNFSGKLYLSEIAGVVGLNPQYFCRFFREATGKPPVEYINSYRIEQAAMLLGSDKQFIEIALQCGFENYSYFIKKFRQYKNCTPAEYRKKLLSR